MSEKVSLRLDWCSHEAAKYAVEHWHYSRCMPSGKIVKIGVWENASFIGCVIFGHGAIYRIGDPYGLSQTECVELVRIALANHKTPVSRIGAVAIKMLQKQSKGLRLIVSYADPKEGHNGAIYQAMNWVYVGNNPAPWKKVKGETVHPRTLYARYGTHSLSYIQEHIDRSAEIVEMPGKYKYLNPLDAAMRAQIEPLRKPYPKRGLGETDNAPGSNPETGGASPTSPLLISDD